MAQCQRKRDFLHIMLDKHQNVWYDNGFSYAGHFPIRSSDVCKILIADDNMDSLLCVRTILSIMGNEVMVAYHGLAAFTMNEDLQPDIVILDKRMPSLTGPQVAQHIREKGPAPLLFELTGLPDEDECFDHCLHKPLNFKQFFELCTQHGFNINPAGIDLELLK